MFTHCFDPKMLIFEYHVYIWYSRLKDFWSSCRKLVWVVFEPTTTEFRSDSLTNWAIRPWFQLILRANIVQLLQLHLLVQCSHIILVTAFASRHICFKRNLAEAITLLVEWIDTHAIHCWSIFEVTIERWPEWDLSPRSLNSVRSVSGIQTPMIWCLPCTHSIDWTIWSNYETCLMVYKIIWPWSSSLC